jgi:hypothetical protein
MRAAIACQSVRAVETFFEIAAVIWQYGSG